MVRSRRHARMRRPPPPLHDHEAHFAGDARHGGLHPLARFGVGDGGSGSRQQRLRRRFRAAGCRASSQRARRRGAHRVLTGGRPAAGHLRTGAGIFRGVQCTLPRSGDSHHFVFYELYHDEAALDAHRAAPRFAIWFATANRHVVPGSWGGQVNVMAHPLQHHSKERA